MRLPVSWLHEHCRPPLTTEEVAERLDLTGTAVERIERHGVGATDAFIVGRVLEAEPHPDADRLSVCRVAVGEGDVAQIVCGAPNVAAGQTVAVAQPGAIMPGGAELGRARLRGVVSEGMILAEDELAVGTDHDGVMVLSEHLVPGTPLIEVLPIATDVIELEITPNRPDCLSVYGLAREVHAATGAPLGPAPWTGDPGSPGEPEAIAVAVEAPDLCPRFTARVFEGVRTGPSPPWLKARLLAAGQRPISNVVDITNYVMLLTGQPLHAFDLDRVEGGRLTVRRGREGEHLETLDGQVRPLDSDMVVIEDAAGPTSLAGVMGGLRSEVGEGTTRVLMEAATWDGPNIQRTSTRLGLRSEASARFEKGLSPEAAMEAQAVAAGLMAEVCGARLAPGTVDVGGPGPVPEPIHLREDRVERVLGAAIPAERCAEILGRLGFGVAAAIEGAPGLDVLVPHFRRRDVTREADLIEEVARLDGLDRLPATLPSRRGATGLLTHFQRARRRAEDALTGCGLHEVVGWSFAAPELADRLRLAPEDPRRRAIALENPMSEDQALLRTTLLGSLLGVARHNAARGSADVRLFETGAVYRPRPQERLPGEPLHLGVVLTGAARPSTWRTPEPPAADVFTVEGVVGAVRDALRFPWSAQHGREPFLHPGRAAEVHAGGEPVGWLGELHPLVARAWDLESAAAAEIDLGAVLAIAPELTLYEEVTPFPPSRQDLAVVVGEEVPADRVLEVARRTCGPLLRRARVFDVYRGEQIGPGRVSLALRLEFRAPDHTLTDEEVSERRTAIADALEAELGAAPRA
jgi:phenylalanyl-tRNA synthetase beta chain